MRVIQGEGEPYGQGYTSADGDYYIDKTTNLIYPLGAGVVTTPIPPGLVGWWEYAAESKVNSSDVITGDFLAVSATGDPLSSFHMALGPASLPWPMPANVSTATLSFNVRVNNTGSTPANAVRVYNLLGSTGGRNLCVKVTSDEFGAGAGSWQFVDIGSTSVFGPVFPVGEVHYNVTLAGGNVFVNGGLVGTSDYLPALQVMGNEQVDTYPTNLQVYIADIMMFDRDVSGEADTMAALVARAGEHHYENN